MSLPTLSVNIPVYNKASSISKQVKVILEQSFKPKEIIIVDDGSTDDSVKVIEGLAEKYPIIQFYKNEQNRGINYTFDRCLEKVTGDYLHSTSPEDPIFPGFYEKSMQMVAQYPQAGLCASLCLRVDDHGNKLATVPEPPYLSNSPTYISPEEALDAFINKEFLIMSCTCILRAKILEEIGGLPHIKHYEDEFWLRLCASNYGVCFIPEPLGQYLISSNSGSDVYRRSPEAVIDITNQTKQFMTSAKYKKYFSPLLVEDFITKNRYLSGSVALTSLNKAHKKSLEDIKNCALQNISVLDRILFFTISFITKTLNLAIKLYLFLRLRKLTLNIFLRVCYRIKNKIFKAVKSG